MFSTTCVKIHINSLTNELTSYTKGKQVIECPTRTMNEQKKPKTRFGKVNRFVKISPSLHEKIKSIAKKRDMKTHELYSQIVAIFLKEVKKTDTPIQYLFHQGDATNKTIYLKPEIVDDLKELVLRDSVSENRIIFTAIMNFFEKTPHID